MCVGERERESTHRGPMAKNNILKLVKGGNNGRKSSFVLTFLFLCNLSKGPEDNLLNIQINIVANKNNCTNRLSFILIIFNL